MIAQEKLHSTVVRSAILHATVSIMLLGLNFIAPSVSIILSGAYVVYLVFRCKVYLVPAIILLFFSRADFLYLSLSEIDRTYEIGSAESLWIGGFPVSISWYLYLGILVYVTYNVFTGRRLKDLELFQGLFLLYLLSSVFPIISTISGKAAGNFAWTTNFRLYASISTVFYGAALYDSWEEGKKVLMKFLFGIFTLMLIMSACRVYNNHLIFTAVCSIFGCCYYQFLQKGILSKVVAASVFLFSIVFGFGIFDENRFQSTITLIGMSAVGAFLVLQKRYGLQVMTMVVSSMARHFLYIASFIVIVVAINNAELLGKENYDASVGYIQRIHFKLFNDRAVLWRAAWQDAIRDGKYLFDTAGSNIEGELRNEITFGAHNSYIEIIRKHRFVTGPLLIFVIVYTTLAAGKVYRSSKDPACVALTIGVINTTIFGMMTGHAPVLGKYWPFVFLISAGMCYAHNEQTMRRKLVAYYDS